MLTERMGTREVRLRVFRTVFILGGALGGAVLPFLARAMVSPYSTDFVSRINDGWFAVLVNAGYGALAGWAVGALIAHMLGER